METESEEEEEKERPKNEYYSATEQGLLSEVKVTVVVDGNRIIQDIIIDASGETPELGGSVMKEDYTSQFVGKRLPEELTDIDAVTGATVTSNAVIRAISKIADELKAGKNSRISGSADKPQSAAGANQPATASGGTQEAASGTTVQMTVKWDPNASFNGAYVLQIGGQPLEWEMDIREAVNLCRQNGLVMENSENGNGHLQYPQDITFGQTMKLNPDLFSFYVDQGANQAEGKLYGIRLYFAMNDDDLDAICRISQEIYEKLEAYLGITADKLRIYHDDEFTDVQGNNMKNAVDQMRRIAKDDYAFVSVDFRTLTLFVGTYDKRTYDVYISLTP